MGMEIHIQEEILMNILSGLPVKSLLRFKCVTKYWKKLISEPYFKKKHLNHTKNQSSRKMLIGQAYCDDTFYFCSSSLSPVQLVKDIQRLDWPLNFKPYHGRVYCSCDDLFLIGIWSKPEDESSILLLWNPAIRKSVVLSHLELPPMGYYVYGLRYDSTTDDYKVLRIDECPNGHNEIHVLKKDGSWRKIDEIPDMTNVFLLWDIDCLALLHGAFHWLGVDPRLCIVSFNILGEIYREIPLPEKVIQNHMGVSVVGGMLCVYYNGNNTFNLWIMKNYGIEDSWTKLLTIPSNGICTITPMYKLSDDEVLLSCCTNSGRMLYRTSSGAFELSNRIWPVDCDDIYARAIQDNIIYTESLISPKLEH